MGESLTLTTSDGERLDGVHVPQRTGRRGFGVVLAHGFTGSWRRPAVTRIARHLSACAGVVAFDFRGHGRSTGLSTVGDREILDLDAAVALARARGYRHVITVGFSMGGSVAVRHAALHGGVDAAVAVSAPARWYYRGTRPMRRVQWVIERRTGRAVARRLFGTRVATTGWDPVPQSPTELAPRVAPTPLLIVHGDRDPYLPVHHAEALHAAARDPRELWLIRGYGHAEAAMRAPLVDRLGRHLPALVAANGAAGEGGQGKGGQGKGG